MKAIYQTFSHGKLFLSSSILLAKKPQAFLKVFGPSLHLCKSAVEFRPIL
jgi:methanogenic corrinoid protein MtbC1